METVPRDSGFGHELQGQAVRLLRTMLTLKLRLRPPESRKQRFIYWGSRLVPVSCIHWMLHRTFTWHNRRPGDYTATLASYHSLQARTVPSSVYDQTVFMDFEGHKMPVPGEYDYLLSHIYGDYMTPPPEDKRVIKHHFDGAEID